MATICFFNIPATGHVHPSLPLVRALVERGDRVICFNTEVYRAKMEGAGAEFQAYAFDYDWEPGQDTLAPFEAMGRILGESARILPAFLETTRELDPDLILYDSMCPWGKQIAERLKRPAIGSCGIMYLGLANLRAWPRNTELSRGMLANPFKFGQGVLKYQWRAFDLYRRFGVHSPFFINFFSNPGKLNLLYTSRYFQIGGDLFGDAFKFVGPLIQPRSDAPLVYVSLGTIFNDRADFFRTCLQAFANSPYRVVMAIGSRIRRADLGEIPANVRALEYVPQLDLLPRARLFITHGGMNSVSEAAWFGAPMLLVPQVGDQVFIAYQVARLGAGLEIDSHRITPNELRARAERVMGNPDMYQASRKIGESFRTAGGVPRALAEIDAFVSQMRR
jgi:MGT family glycosyltransferase